MKEKKYFKSVKEMANFYQCSYGWAHKIKNELPESAILKIGRGFRINQEVVERHLRHRQEKPKQTT